MGTAVPKFDPNPNLKKIAQPRIFLASGKELFLI